MAAASSPGPGVSAAPDTRPGWRVGGGSALTLGAGVLAGGRPALDIFQAPPATAPVHDHEVAQAAPIVHSSDAIAVAAELLPILVAGLSLVMPALLTSERAFALVGGLSLLYADGLLHWFAILEHVGAAPFMWFFAASGAVQIFAIPFAMRWERVAWWSGVALSLFFLVLYAFVLIVPEPLSGEPEGVTGLGLLSKAAELGILGGMAGYFGNRIVPGILRRPLQNRRLVELLLAGSVLTAGGPGKAGPSNISSLPRVFIPAPPPSALILFPPLPPPRPNTLAAGA